MAIEKSLDKIKKKNMYILPSVLPRYSPKPLFAECLGLGTRQRLTPLTAVMSWRAFAECHPLPSARHSAKYFLPSVLLCRVSKDEFIVCFPLPSVALGKEDLCRVLDILRSANLWTLGKVLVSGSASLVCIDDWWSSSV
jgi:hypothetical protein